MRKLLRSAVLAGAAAIAAVGTAVAATNESRIMTVDLPDGSLARIEYRGDVAPKVTVEPAVQFVPVRFVDPDMIGPFALFNRIAADMDRQMDAMLRQARDVELTALGSVAPDRMASLPAGTVGYRFVSTSDGSGTCSRSIRVTSFGPGQEPKVVSSSSGDCGAPAHQPAPAAAASRSAAPARTA